MKTTPATAISEIMQTTASMPLPDLLAALRKRGLTLTEEKFEQAWLDDKLRALARVELTEPELVINLPLVLAGRVFTHRLDDEEVDGDLLYTLPDFAGIWPLLETSPFDRIGGHLIVDDFDEELQEGVIRLAPGTLADYEAGSMIAISATADGLVLQAAPEPEPAELARLSSALVDDYLEIFGADLLNADAELAEDEDESIADTPEPRGPVALEEFLTLVLSRHPQIFATAGWPVEDLLEQLDLDHDNGSIAVAGFDFDADFDARAEAEELEMLIETYDLEPVQAAVVQAFSAAIQERHQDVHDWADDHLEEDLDEDDFPDVPAEGLLPLLPALSDPMVAVAIAEENLADDPHLSMILTAMLDSLDGRVPRRAQAGFTWLQGRCADKLGEVVMAEAAYEHALSLDADHFPAMRELAAIASLRGDASKAASLLLRAGVPMDDPELVLVSPFAGDSRSDVGRNDACWCGSGKKYKKCHLGKADHDLASRWNWLYQKASHWVRNGRGRDLLVELAAVRAHPATDPADLIAAVNDPIVTDVALFEGELLAEFLDDRGALLPTDERELATQWLSTRRALYMLEGAGAGEKGLRVKDVATGAVIEVAAQPVATDGLVCLRLLPSGAGWVISGGIQSVDDGAREVTAAMLALQDLGQADPERVITVLTTGATT